jgi:hypothetical protein
MQLVLGNWANFQLQVSLATENQLHKIVTKWQISSSETIYNQGVAIRNLYAWRNPLWNPKLAL